MKVRDLMTTAVQYCEPYNTLNSAAHLMWENDVGCVPVVDTERRVIGMLTDRDVCMAAFLQGVALTGSLVTSAMSKEVFSCSPEDDISTAERIMHDKQVRRLPVIDFSGRLAGIISLNDIAREGEQEAELKQTREISDAEITRVMASVCAPRQRVVQASV